MTGRDLQRSLETLAGAAAGRTGEPPTDGMRARVRRRRVATGAGRGLAAVGVVGALVVAGVQQPWTTVADEPLVAGWDCGERATGTDAPPLEGLGVLDATPTVAPGGELVTHLFTEIDDPSVAFARRPLEEPAVSDGVPAVQVTVAGTEHVLVIVLTDEAGRVVSEGARLLPELPSMDSGFPAPPRYGIDAVSCVNGSPLPEGSYLLQAVHRTVGPDGTAHETAGASPPVVVGHLTPEQVAEAEVAYDEARQTLWRAEARAEEDRLQASIQGLVDAPTGTFPGCASVVPPASDGAVRLAATYGSGDPPHEGKAVTVSSTSDVPVVVDGGGLVARMVAARDGVVVALGAPDSLADTVGLLTLAPGGATTLGLPPIVSVCGGEAGRIVRLPPGTYEVHAVIEATVQVGDDAPRTEQLVSPPTELVIPETP